jgi:hypothetical protein
LVDKLKAQLVMKAYDGDPQEQGQGAGAGWAKARGKTS